MGENVNSKWWNFAWSGDLGETWSGDLGDSREVMNEIFKFPWLSYLNNTYNW